jgi:hypothetical protein
MKDKKSRSFKDVLSVLKGIPIAISALVLTFFPMLFIGGFHLMVITFKKIRQIRDFYIPQKEFA